MRRKKSHHKYAKKGRQKLKKILKMIMIIDISIIENLKRKKIEKD